MYSGVWISSVQHATRMQKSAKVSSYDARASQLRPNPSKSDMRQIHWSALRAMRKAESE